jgi:Flp pilus assembly pilin Flp
VPVATGDPLPPALLRFRQSRVEEFPMMRGILVRLAGEHGASTVEYAFLLVFIAILALVALAAFGQSVASNLLSNGSKIG